MVYNWDASTFQARLRWSNLFAVLLSLCMWPMQSMTWPHLSTRALNCSMGHVQPQQDHRKYNPPVTRVQCLKIPQHFKPARVTWWDFPIPSRSSSRSDSFPPKKSVGNSLGLLSVDRMRTGDQRWSFWKVLLVSCRSWRPTSCPWWRILTLRALRASLIRKDPGNLFQ